MPRNHRDVTLTVQERPLLDTCRYAHVLTTHEFIFYSLLILLFFHRFNHQVYRFSACSNQVVIKDIDDQHQTVNNVAAGSRGAAPGTGYH